jgi:hypothetical protein
MDRTLLGDRKEYPPLLGGELALELDLDVYLIDQAARVLAVSAVFGVRLPVWKVDLHPLQGPTLTLGVHPQGDDLASSQCREEKFIGRRSGILASGTQGFICLKPVSPDEDVFQEVWRRTLNQYIHWQPQLEWWSQ